MKILLVDDNSEMRRLIKSMIAETAAEITEASDGGQAVELYRTNRPDWVLMDIFMKPVDGLTAATAMKSLDRAARIAFVSNHTDKRTRQAAREAGGREFFGKADLLGLVEFLKAEKPKF